MNACANPRLPSWAWATSPTTRGRSLQSKGFTVSVMIPTVTGDDPVYESRSQDLHVLGLVPARGGSQRLPGKNLAQIGGRSLVRRALETAVVCPSLALVALSSDDDRILGEAQGLERVLPIER